MCAKPLSKRLKNTLRRIFVGDAGARPVIAPLDSLYCDDVVYAGQPFAGGPLASFPMVVIFQTYEKDRDRAFELFGAWMREWLLERDGWKTPKTEGGMQNGSMCRLIEELHRRDNRGALAGIDQAGDAVIDEAIRLRAEHYFAVFGSIKTRGFDATLQPPITSIMREDRRMIKNGHHRAAALLVLGYNEVPVYPHPS